MPLSPRCSHQIISHLLHIRHEENFIIHQIRGPSNFLYWTLPLASFALLLPTLLLALLSCLFPQPTSVLNITPGKQNILWHHRRWYNYFKPASSSGKVLWVHLSSKTESKHSHGMRHCFSVGFNKLVSCAHIPFQVFVGGWFCLPSAIMVSVSHQF